MKSFPRVLLGLSIFVGVNVMSGGSKVNSRVPDWAKKAVWYQIFPERFANGTPINDPTPADMEGAWPYNISEGWNISPWTSDWYKLQPWEKANGHNFYWNAGCRRYGGDIEGMINRLGYLQDLGVTAIYLTPIFESPSSHKYDTGMYNHVDDNFGPNPSADKAIVATENPADPASWKWTSADSLFLRLVREVHKRGMKIILDGVFNHVGTSFWAFRDVVKKQQASPFKSWFKVASWDNPATPANEFVYEGWNGVKDLPEISKTGVYGLADGFAEHVHSIVKRWMDPDGDGNPSDGIDGWRLDVAEKVGIPFWRQFRQWVREINPDAYIAGEVWWQNWRENQMFDPAPWLQGDVFDGVMNYRFARAVKQFVVDVKRQISPQAFIDSLDSMESGYPIDNCLALMNLLDSHDVDRIASQIVNPDRWYDHDANPSQNQAYNVRKPTAIERMKHKLIVGIQMTMPGAPMIYYGDEAGMWGGDDPDCRKPMVWPDKQYEPEQSDPLGRKRDADSVFFDRDLFAWYKKLIELRKNNTELSVGNTKFITIDNARNVVGYTRTFGDSSLVVVINNSNSEQSVTVRLPLQMAEVRKTVNLITGLTVAATGSSCSIRLMPYEIAVLRSM